MFAHVCFSSRGRVPLLAQDIVYGPGNTDAPAAPKRKADAAKAISLEDIEVMLAMRQS